MNSYIKTSIKKRKYNPKSCDECRRVRKKCAASVVCPPPADDSAESVISNTNRSKDPKSNNCDRCSKKGIDCTFDMPRGQRGRPGGTSNNVTVTIPFYF